MRRRFRGNHLSDKEKHRDRGVNGVVDVGAETGDGR